MSLPNLRNSEIDFLGDSGGPLFRFEPTTKQFTAIGLTVGAVAEYASKVTLNELNSKEKPKNIYISTLFIIIKMRQKLTINSSWMELKLVHYSSTLLNIDRP